MLVGEVFEFGRYFILLEELSRDIVLALKSLEEKLEGVVLLGSMAQGEAGERSDVDVFVVLSDECGSMRPIERRWIYSALDSIRAKYSRDTTVIDAVKRELGDITPLLLNIAAEGRILFDRSGFARWLLETVKKKAKNAGLVRYRTDNDKYGWKMKRPLKPGK